MWKLEKRNHQAFYVVILLTLTAVFFHKALMPGSLFFYLDHSFQNIPFRYFAFETIKRGTIPLWCPFAAGGFPMFAEGQSGISYPVNWVFYLFLQFSAAYNLSLISHVLLMGIGFYLIYSRLGLRSCAAISGSVSIIFSGYFIRKLMFVNYIQGFAWLPWLLLIITPRDLNAINPRKSVIAGSLILSMISFAGHPQVLLFAVICLWMYGLTVPAGNNLGRRLLIIAAITCIGLILSAWQLMPSVELVSQTPRSNPQNASLSTQMSMPPAYLPTILFKDPFGSAADGTFLQSNWPAYEWELNCFIGICVFALAMFNSFADRRTQLFWTIITVGVFLMIGEYAFLSDIIYGLPVISSFRAPVRWGFMVVFGFSGLQAQAIHTLVCRKRNWSTREIVNRLLLAWIPVFGFVFFAISQHGLTELNREMHQAFLGGVLFLSCVSILILFASKGIRSIGFAFPLLIFFELFWAQQGYPGVSDETMILGTPKILQHLSTEQGRILSLYHEHSPLVNEQWHQNWTLPGYGDYPKLKESLTMYSGLIYKAKIISFDEWSPLHYKNYRIYASFAPQMESLILKNFNIDYILIPKSYNRFQGIPINLDGNRLLQRVRDHNDSSKISFREPKFTQDSDLDCIHRMINQNPGSDETILRSSKGKIPENLQKSWTMDGEVSDIKADFHRLEFKIESDQQACVFISESFDPGWEAALDGKRTPLYEADLMFQGLIIPRGNHVVSINYRPISYRIGLFLSLLTLMAITFFKFLPVCRERAYEQASSREVASSSINLFILTLNVGIILLMIAGFVLKTDLWIATISNWLLL